MVDDKGDDPARALLDEGLEFFGAVTASVTHDLNNVISIIDQTSGLVQDMISAEKSGVPMNIDRLSDAVASTQKQTRRGLTIVGRLNRFAHSADVPLVEFEVTDVVGNLVDISRRLAELKRARVELRPSPERVQLEGNPFFLQAAVFRVLRSAFDVAQASDTVRVSVGADDGRVLVNVDCPRRIDSGGNDMKVLELVMRRLNGRIEVQQLGDGTVVELRFSSRGSGPVK